MRKSFGSDVPLADQLRRIVKVSTGRKHMHKQQASKTSAERSAHQRIEQGKQQKRRRLFLAKARAYWAGESEEHPSWRR